MSSNTIPKFRTKDIIDPSYPLLEANRATIESIKRKTFTYASTEEHKLDVYYPPSLSTNASEAGPVLTNSGTQPLPAPKPHPVLIFFYGGGLTKGSRAGALRPLNPDQGSSVFPSADLVHANLGAFFASRGFLTVIPDYRLVRVDCQSASAANSTTAMSSQSTARVDSPHSSRNTESGPAGKEVSSIIYPQGSEDVRDAISWVIAHIHSSAPELDVSYEASKRLSPGIPPKIFLLGHSAGGLHLSSLFLSLSLISRASDPILPHIFGITLLGVPYSPSPSRKEMYNTSLVYYTSQKLLKDNVPTSLLREVPKTHLDSLPPILNMRAESEPRAIKEGIKAFTVEWRKRAGLAQEEWSAEGGGGGGIKEVVLEGHDHFSPILALSTGDKAGEVWAEELINWMRGILGEGG